MYLVNHYLDVSILGIDIPNQVAASTTNGKASIMAQADECNALYARYPNFILVSPPHQYRIPLPLTALVRMLTCLRPCVHQLDWISVGDFLAVQAYLNGVGSL